MPRNGSGALNLPRNGSGKYSLPANYIATSGETITAIQHNSPLTDIAADLNAARPLITGGTGATTAADARSNLSVYSKAEADAATDAAIDDLGLGTAATTDADAYATAEQGTLADGSAQAADLASTSASKGASLVGVEDSAGNFTGATVEAVLAELVTKLSGLMIGVGQTWQDVLTSRAVDTSYRNTTGKPIQVWVDGGSSAAIPYVSSDGSTWVRVGLGIGGSMRGFGYFIVPNNHYYKCSGGGAPVHWVELR